MNLVTGAEARRFDADTIGIRPEHMNISMDNGLWTGTVGVAERLGSDTYFHVRVDGLAEPLSVRTDGGFDIKSGSPIYLIPDEQRIHRFDEQGARIN